VKLLAPHASDDAILALCREWLDLPLDGTWSDLTAQFEFGPHEGGTAVALYDLHVL
jgi:hypothetical protein